METWTGISTPEGELAQLAETKCFTCNGIHECALNTNGWSPKLDREATVMYKYPSYMWSPCHQLQKQEVREQVQNNINERFKDRTFESYSINQNNKSAFDACWDYAKNFGWSTHDGLIMVGTFGTGKTHLAAAILKNVLDKGIPGAMVVVPQLLDEIRQSYNNMADVDKRLEEKVRNKRFLILDDLGAEKTTEWVREKLYNLINHRYENNLPTIITTNCTIEELKEKHGETTVDRIIEMCEGVKFIGDSYRVKIRKDKRRTHAQ